MSTRRVIRAIFMPFAVAAIVAGSVSVAGSALADDDDDYEDYYDPGESPFYAPDIYADPATEWVPWASGVASGAAQAPSVDTTVTCDGCIG